MHKIMLVDDDYPVLMYLAENIPWDELEIEVIGTFENGLKALEEAEKCPPDLLITDIGMPKMNGLELIEEVKKFNPDLLSIILSCHDDFKFAQKAIQLRVDDYILKETINADIIIEKLQEFKNSLEKNDLHFQQVELLKISEDELSTLKSQWIRNTLKSEVWDMERWEQEALNYKIDLNRYKCIPVMGYMGNSTGAKLRYNMSDTLLEYASSNIINEIISKYNNLIYFQYSHDIFFLFILNDGKQFVDVNKILMDMHADLEKVLSVKTLFMIGNKCSTIHGFRHKLLELWSAKNQFFYRDQIIITFTEEPFSEEDIYVYYLEILDDFRNCLFESDKKGITLLIDHWFQFIKQKNYQPHIVKEFFSKVLIELQIKMKFIIPSDHFKVEESIYDRLSYLHQLSEVKHYIVQFFEKSIFLMEEIYKRSKRKEILNVQRYIIFNIDRNISLNEVANQFHINHSHLSRLFKRETGENFLEYVTRMKINRAKELLDKSNRSVEEISEQIGYEKGYFHKIFKKVTGVTPNEYRTYY